MEAKEVKKLYYSISEVSEISGLKQYVLRYWETEFKELNPNKNKAGNRIYKTIDLDLVLKIKNLLYERKFTIKGAKQYLIDKNNQSNNFNTSQKIIKLTNNIDLHTIKNIKRGLDDLIDLHNLSGALLPLYYYSDQPEF